MDINKMKRARISRANKIKAVKAAKNMPTAILLQKKAECDAKALKIVERLIEPNVDIKWMLDVLGQINQTHLEDVVDERAIEKICGYVLCDNKLTKVVNKKYHISTLKNKVYDVEKVRNFCSFTCYSAMNHLIMQMLTSPLWLRNEEEIPQFSLLENNKKRTKSPPGLEINIMGIELPHDDDNISEKKKDESEQESDEEIFENNEIKRKKGFDENESISLKSKIHSNSPIVRTEKRSLDIKEYKHNINKNLTKDSSIDNKKTDRPKSNRKIKVININDLSSVSQDSKLSESNIDKTVNLKDVKESLNLPESVASLINDIKQFNVSSNLAEKTNTSIQNVKNEKTEEKLSLFSEPLEIRLKRAFDEWITKHTSSFLHGKQTDKMQMIKTTEFHEKYNALCRKLDKLQFEVESDELETPVVPKNLKPAPHYKALQDQTEELTIKTRAFYEGKLEIKVPGENSNQSNDNQDSNTFIPLTDAHDPRALRRRIFLDKLNRILPDVLHTLIGSDEAEYLYNLERISSVKALINTFNLTAKNIVFKTAEWILVSLLIIKILALVDTKIESLLSTKNATIHSSMILMSYKLDSDYLDKLIDKLKISPKIDHVEDFIED